MAECEIFDIKEEQPEGNQVQLSTTNDKLEVNNSYECLSNQTKEEDQTTSIILDKQPEEKALSDEVDNLNTNSKEKVINQSESTVEEKAFDFDHNYKLLLKSKDYAKKIADKNKKDGLEAFLAVNKDIDYIIGFTKDKESKEYKDIIGLKKIIFSNMANCYFGLGKFKESIRIDETILVKFDQKFDKSYGRLVRSYIRIGELNRANDCMKTMVKYFGTQEDFKEKFKVVMQELDEANEKGEKVNNVNNKSLNDFGKKVKKNFFKTKEEKKKNALQKKFSNKSKKMAISTSSNLSKILFGTSMFIVSSLWLIFLFKWRGKFSSN